MRAGDVPVTKYQPPAPGPDTLVRDRLLHRLDAAVDRHAVTLVSAPAGFGKTTLLASYCRDHASRPFAWVSLDEADDDPFGFVASVARAVHRTFPHRVPVPDVDPTFPEPRSIPFAVRQTLSAWINAVVETITEPFILVLDDVHEITKPAVFAPSGFADFCRDVHEVANDGREFRMEDVMPILQKLHIEVTGPPLD